MGNGGTPGADGVIERFAARVVLLNRAGQILLQEFQPNAGAPSMWITPGGGLNKGETYEAAAMRETYEEVGHDATLGPWIWSRLAEFEFRGRRYRQHERYYLARCDHFEARPARLEAIEEEIVIGHRWWTPDEVDASPATFAPRRLAAHLRPLLTGPLPKQPIDVGL